MDRLSMKLCVALAVLQMAILCTECSPACTWPKFFDVSKRGWPIKDEERSWETETKIESDVIKINWYAKARKLVSIWDNHTLDIVIFVDKAKTQSRRYTCAKDFGDNMFALKNTGLYSINPPGAAATYMCIQLYQRSQFVLQWREGAESTNMNCQPNFAPVSPWPLVYFPVRETSPFSNLNKYHDLLNQYTPCPPEGGYTMTIQSSTNFPRDLSCESIPVRLEIECASGEGILLTEPNKCDPSNMVSGVGSKLFCLGAWEDGQYRFRVLIPAGENKVNGFHCLRVNKADPLREDAILFLDNVCLVSSPDPSAHAFLRLQLRQKNITSLCDDFKDGCVAGGDCGNSSQVRNECYNTCQNCPAENVTKESDENVRGTWLLQKKKEMQEIVVDVETFTFPGLGSFKAVSVPGEECIPAPKPLKDDANEYVLVQLNRGVGCVPRVTQFRMKSVAASKAVALIQIVGTAPLRSKFGDSLEGWCKSNLIDAQKFAPLFSPYWPFNSYIGTTLGRGFYTVVKKDVHEKVPCQMNTDTLKYAAHMQLKIEFNTDDKVYTCHGKSHTLNDHWNLELQKCNVENATGGFFKFQCLANYEASERYHALTLEKSPQMDSAALNLSDQYYCLLIPKAEHNNLPIILNNAGECDDVFASWVIDAERKPIAKITFLETIAQYNITNGTDKEEEGRNDGNEANGGGNGSKGQGGGAGKPPKEDERKGDGSGHGNKGNGANHISNFNLLGFFLCSISLCAALKQNL